MPCSSLIISEILPEIHTMEKCYFLKYIIHSQFNSVLLEENVLEETPVVQRIKRWPADLPVPDSIPA